MTCTLLPALLSNCAAVAAPATLVACGWDGGPALEPRLRAWSRVKDWVGEKLLYTLMQAGHVNDPELDARLVLKRAELHVLDRCGHWAQLQRWDAMLPIIRSHFGAR